MSFGSSGEGSAWTLGDVVSHQLTLRYGMTSCPSDLALAAMPLRSALEPQRGSGGRKSGCASSNPPDWNATGWMSAGDGSCFRDCPPLVELG